MKKKFKGGLYLLLYHMLCKRERKSGMMEESVLVRIENLCKMLEVVILGTALSINVV